VLGRGRGGLAELLGGSVTHVVLEHAKCPVAVVGQQPATGGAKPATPPAGSSASRIAKQSERG
jgi:hypothetical protein